MNVARNAISAAVRARTYATMYVPPAALENIIERRHPRKPAPESPNFYTGRAAYFDQVNALESAIQHTRSALQTLELLPLPVFARESIPPAHNVWMTKEALADKLNARLTTSRYRRLLGLLNQLDSYRRIADVAGVVQLAERVADVLQIFERENKAAVLAQGKRKPVQFDQYGRSYTIGRRKESTARVWMIPVQRKEAAADASTSAALAAPEGLEAQTADSLPPLESSVTSAFDDAPVAPVEVTTSNILINNTPLVQYFPLLTDRERIIRPFRIAGLIGAYNVFALVRGGGTTGQSGAVSLGVAKALAAHAPDVEPLLKKAKLLRRDPRMVERKKTGRAKARKAYTWVKR
ncbi:ribosomal protein S5 domain 2-like protein [Wolfiporia cocos MD-104 SS10]|uniref:Ribosomal protein S5 domain 2-like protein n=1 Tax=Wolfiporia cocos (strain MD-104) TaxID=742152 RepID=A0A2H3K0I0_WOLCO|nr:ribosomal protein S5 domain 2-like protein [Wolfiporia cocos MD-104 SS10]